MSMRFLMFEQWLEKSEVFPDRLVFIKMAS